MSNSRDKDKINRRDALIEYMTDMEIQKYSYKYKYTEEELREILLVARKILRSTDFQQSNENERLTISLIITDFLESLRSLKSDMICDYYKNKLKNISTIRDESLDYGDGRAEFTFCFNGENNYEILLPRGELTFENEMTYAHEMGHIPELDMPRKSYLEYQEVFPIFMEYLIILRKYGPLNAKDCFIRERLPMDKIHARNIKHYYKECDSPIELFKLYSKQELGDNYKYLESAEYVLNLIELFSNYRKKVSSEIEDYIGGKSLVDIANDLEIETKGCKKLLKEYQRNGDSE